MAELRRDPLLNRWIIIAPERAQRPVEIHTIDEDAMADTQVDDPFKEGNEHLTPPEIFAVRANGSPPNGSGWSIRVVPNRFPALRVEGELTPRGIGLYDKLNGIGAHEVVIDTPDADASPETMGLGHLTELFRTYQLRLEDLYQDRRFAYVLVFKNHGRRAGATMRHSHSQIIATPVVPRLVLEEIQNAHQHWGAKQRSIFADILEQENRDGDRLVFENSSMTAFCPWASASPFEVHIYPRNNAADFRLATRGELTDLAEACQACLRMWRKVLGPVAYNYLLHTVPNESFQDNAHEKYHQLGSFYTWHLEMIPRFTDSAGFEWGTGFYINHTPPEEAAAAMRNAEVSGA